MRRLLKRWADDALQRENAELRAKVAALEAETETMALVIARDRERVKAELAAYSKARADAEGPLDERAG